MLDLTHKQKQEEERKKPFFILKFIKVYYKQILLYGSLAFLSYEILFEPVYTATLIGQWVHDFFGTIASKSRF